MLVWIQIRGSMPLTLETQKHVDPQDPDSDPEHCLKLFVSETHGPETILIT
jgi:hypothetical protein